MGWDFYSKGVKVELGVSEGLPHGDSAEFPFIPQLVVKEEEVSISVDSWHDAVQYKYTTYCVPMPDVPDNAVHVGVGYVGGSEGTAGFWAFIPVYVAVPMAVVGTAVEDHFHYFSVGDSASGLLGVFIGAEPADGLETGCCGVFGHPLGHVSLC